MLVGRGIEICKNYKTKPVTDLEEAGQDEHVRSIVLRGEGKVFSSGHNLKAKVVLYTFYH